MIMQVPIPVIYFLFLIKIKFRNESWKSKKLLIRMFHHGKHSKYRKLVGYSRTSSKVQ